jgi:hypothetical protein
MPCLSVLAVFVGRLLTIIISGLYFSVDVPLTEEIRLQRTDNFNYTRKDLSKSDNLASVTTRLIYYQNLSYPQWTYNNLDFPQLTYADPIDPAHNETTILWPSASMYQDPSQRLLVRQAHIVQKLPGPRIAGRNS